MICPTSRLRLAATVYELLGRNIVFVNTGPEAWITLHEVVTSEKSSGSKERGGSGEGYNRETMSYVFGGSRGYQSLGGTDV